MEAGSDHWCATCAEVRLAPDLYEKAARVVAALTHGMVGALSHLWPGYPIVSQPPESDPGGTRCTVSTDPGER